MIRIEIQSDEILTRNGIAARTGRPFEFRYQLGFAHTVDSNGSDLLVPEAIEISVPPRMQPYAPGLYELAPGSVYVNRFRQLEVSPVLKRLN